jgi:hypothetical protein
MVKKLVFALLFVFLYALPIKAQFEESKERKKMWHKSRKRGKKRMAFNPYLEKKEKPSQKQGKENAKVMKDQGKNVKKQRKANKKAQRKQRRWDHKKITLVFPQKPALTVLLFRS